LNSGEMVACGDCGFKDRQAGKRLPSGLRIIR
jgi:Zn ribbon nucleic-acid-binding protein